MQSSCSDALLGLLALRRSAHDQISILQISAELREFAERHVLLQENELLLFRVLEALQIVAVRSGLVDQVAFVTRSKRNGLQIVDRLLERSHNEAKAQRLVGVQRVQVAELRHETVVDQVVHDRIDAQTGQVVDLRQVSVEALVDLHEEQSQRSQVRTFGEEEQEADLVRDMTVCEHVLDVAETTEEVARKVAIGGAQHFVIVDPLHPGQSVDQRVVVLQLQTDAVAREVAPFELIVIGQFDALEADHRSASGRGSPASQSIEEVLVALVDAVVHLVRIKLRLEEMHLLQVRQIVEVDLVVEVTEADVRADQHLEIDEDRQVLDVPIVVRVDEDDRGRVDELDGVQVKACEEERGLVSEIRFG